MSETEKLVFVYSTFPDLEAAERSGRAVVENGLAACINILPRMVSLYSWQGAVCRDEEVVLIAKTRASLAESVMASIGQTHPYEVPALLVVPLGGASEDYEAWLLKETAGAAG